VNDALATDAYISIFENAVEGIFQTLPDGRYLRVNPALAQIYGYESADALMENLTDIATQLYVHPESRAQFMALIEERGVVNDFESEIRRRDGSTRWISENARAVRDASGHLLYYEGFVVDITERKQARAREARLEGELRQAQKMTALGSLAGGIAHDIKTLLHIIDGHASMARGESARGNPRGTQEHLDRIAHIVGRGNELVERIGAFGRGRDARLEPVAVDVIVLDVIRMLQASLPPSVEIRQQIELDAGKVLADPTQIFQLLINLCTNAFRAMGERGGVLHVGLNVVDLDDGSEERPADLEPGDYLRLAIRDTGQGMDEDTADQIFEPLFSTKAEDEAMSGFGLAIVQGIVAGLGGAVRVDSSPGAGACFTVYMPVHDQTAGDDTILARLGSRLSGIVSRTKP